jgi:hypothetical protein
MSFGFLEGQPRAPRRADANARSNGDATAQLFSAMEMLWRQLRDWSCRDASGGGGNKEKSRWISGDLSPIDPDHRRVDPDLRNVDRDRRELLIRDPVLIV